MNAFLAIAVAMTAIAIGCVLVPLLRPARSGSAAPLSNLHVLREQMGELDAAMANGSLAASDHAEASEELRRRVIQEGLHCTGHRPDRPQGLLAAVLALGVPLVAAGLYYHTGSPAALLVTDAPRAAEGPQHAISVADVSTLVQRLSDRLRQQPADADGWYMLARSYTAIGRYQDALGAYQRLLVLVPDDSAVLADYADVLATVQGGTLAGKPEEIVLRALQHNPQDVKALALAGSAAFQRGDLAAARTRWEQLLPLAPAGSVLHQGTLASLERLQRTAGDTAGAGIAGTVTLAPALQALVAPADLVFIVVRDAAGKGPPLAVQRITVAQLPFRFVLDDSHAMAPGAVLSGAREVLITARVSRSGSVMPSSGDPIGKAGPLPLNSRNIGLQIDRRIE